MTRAEQRANERYPLMQEGDIEGLDALKYMGIEFDSVYEFNSARYVQQNYFIDGYKQAEKDFIKKATEWLEENLSEYCDGEDIEYTPSSTYNLTILQNERMIEDFKKAMRDENDND